MIIENPDFLKIRVFYVYAFISLPSKDIKKYMTILLLWSRSGTMIDL